MSLTGHADTDFKVLLLLEDLDLENLKETSKFVHLTYDHFYLWFCKIKYLYPDLPILSHFTAYRALYYKLKYNKWSDIVTYADVHHLDTLSHWIIHQHSYVRCFDARIIKMVKASQLHNTINNKKIIINIFSFLFVHHHLINHPKKASFKLLMYSKLNEFSLRAPDLKELFDLYIKIFFTEK